MIKKTKAGHPGEEEPATKTNNQVDELISIFGGVVKIYIPTVILILFVLWGVK